MKSLILAITLYLVAAGQSFALSCIRPTIEGSYQFHADATEKYILVSGQLTKKRNVVRGPKTQNGIGARSENFTATFVGHQATRSGFDRPLKITVAISATCAGPWCGSVNIDIPMITFFEVTSYGHNLSEGPCGGSVFYNPTKEQTNSVLQCLRGGVCTPQVR